MEKEKIISSHNTKKMWWITVTPNTKSLQYIHEILKKFDDWGLTTGVNDVDRRLIYSEWKNNNHYFFTDNEAGYIFFMENGIEILLRIENKLFNKLRGEFLKYFEFKIKK